MTKKNSTIDILLLCETFLNKNTVSLVNLPGYKMISNHSTSHKGGGTAILIRDGKPFRRWKDLDIFLEKETESIFIEVTAKNGMPIVIGSMYRTPNTSSAQFTKHMSEIISRIKQDKKKKEIIIGMDHNMDLLKSEPHAQTHTFLDMMLEH